MKILIRLLFITSVLLFSYNGYSQQDQNSSSNIEALESLNTTDDEEITEKEKYKKKYKKKDKKKDKKKYKKKDKKKEDKFEILGSKLYDAEDFWILFIK